MPVEAPLSAYVQEFDPRAYLALEEVPVEEYSERRKSLDAYTTTQIQTLLGERFKVGLSAFKYEISDGVLYGENMEEPALDSFIRGRDYRREIGSGVDFAREDAEVVGFKKAQDFLGKKETPKGSMMLSISPKGKDRIVNGVAQKSSYQHNFYDVFTKMDDHIEARRYSSALMPEDYSERLGFQEVFDAEFLLSHPFDVTGMFENAEELHVFLHENHDYLDEAKFRERILVEVAPFIANYIRACANDGLVAQKLAFNSIINVADEVRRRIKLEAEGIYLSRIDYSAGAVIRYGMQKVQMVAGGCGNVQGFTFDDGSFRVSDFDPEKQDQYGSLEVRCPACGAISTRPRGELLDKCANQACSDPGAIACKPE